MRSEYSGWGNYPRVVSELTVFLHSRNQSIDWKEAPHFLPYGLGRSYGDSCLNDQSGVIQTRGLDRLIALDAEAGTLTCEAGVSFAEVLEYVLPRGFFLPVTPGTKFVTVGGAISNDVHGKNHHAAGTFGNHVLRFELLRSDGSRKICSPDQNPELFAATIGGLGLTGLITWAEFKLLRVAGPWIDQEVVRYRGLSEFLELSAQAEGRFDYTVAWIDCLAGGKNLGRGHFIQGNHSESQKPGPSFEKMKRSTLGVPVPLPVSPLFGASVKAFNTLYYRRQLRRVKRGVVHFDPFFYPLDSIQQWNRIYGRNGFLQYQFVVPENPEGLKALSRILEFTSSRGMGSFLAVMKIFGKICSPGLLSFPRPGITLALDFKATTPGLLDSLTRFDGWVMEAGGAVYPAKDARMSPEVFSRSFSELERFKAWVDPAFSSSFWRRMEQK